MFRVGIVQAQDVIGPHCRVRVTFRERNQMISWWLPIIRHGAQNDKDFWIPDIGEQVGCLMDDHDEDGCVLGTFFSQPDHTQNGMTGDKRNLTVKDGAVFEYDRNSHTLTVNIPPGSSTINITVNGPCNITASQSDVTVTASQGSVNVKAPSGNITFKTNEHTDSVNGMIDVFNAHVHTDPSEGNTGIPTTQMP